MYNILGIKLPCTLWSLFRFHIKYKIKKHYSFQLIIQLDLELEKCRRADFRVFECDKGQVLSQFFLKLMKQFFCSL